MLNFIVSSFNFLILLLKLVVGNIIKMGRGFMEKVTMQDIADMLGISRVTVWKVLNNRSGVSKKFAIKCC